VGVRTSVGSALSPFVASTPVTSSTVRIGSSGGHGCYDMFNTSSIRVNLLVPALFSLALAAAPASAAQFRLAIDGCTGSCGDAPFGTVSVLQDGADTVKLTASLDSGNKFVSTGFPGSFAFNIIGNPAIAVSNVTAGWSLLSTTAGNVKFSAFGNFDYALVCNVCGNGNSGPFAAPVSFDVTAAGLTPDRFQELSRVPPGTVQGFFVADILGGNGNSGIVGANAVTSNAPEPDSFVLCGLGALMVIFGALRRRQVARLRSVAAAASQIFVQTGNGEVSNTGLSFSTDTHNPFACL
jgi:hypothetical protein